MIKFEITLLFKNNKVLYNKNVKLVLLYKYVRSPSIHLLHPLFPSAPPGGPVVFLQWSPSFTSQHAVERYRVIVTPDPSSCSSQQASPSEDYTCSRLVLGTHYSFTVSAINCGNQEGTRETFAIQPQGIK